MKTELKGWIAADPDGKVKFHANKPHRYNCENIEYWVNYAWTMPIPNSVAINFRELTWYDEPREVKITIEEQE